MILIRDMAFQLTSSVLIESLLAVAPPSGRRGCSRRQAIQVDQHVVESSAIQTCESPHPELVGMHLAAQMRIVDEGYNT